MRISSPATRSKKIFLLSALALTSPVLPTRTAANNISWIATVGDWANSSNWSSGVPTASDAAYINNGGTAVISSGNALAEAEYIGNGGPGNIQQTGGTNTTTILQLGVYGGTSTYDLNAGALTVHGIEYIGYFETGVGIVNQSNGLNSADQVFLGEFSGATGTYNLMGGTLAVAEDLFVGSANLEDSGSGNLTVSDAGELTIQGLIQVDSGSHITIAGGNTSALQLRDDDNYSQSGGTATFGQMNANAVTLNGGTLTFPALENANVAWMYDYFDSLNISGNAVFQIGPGLNLNSLNMTGGTIQLGTSGAEIDVQGPANLSAGSISFFVTGVPNSSCYPLLTAQSLSSSIPLTPFTVGRLTFTPYISGNSIIANVTGSPACLTWNNAAGGDGQTWDIQTNQNWTSTASLGNPNQFYTLDSVIFNDSNNGNYNVNIIPAGVQPNAITVDTSGAYTFSGGAITGGNGGLTVTQGTLNLLNANLWYTATIDGGTLGIGASGSLYVNGTETIGQNNIGFLKQTGGTNTSTDSFIVGDNLGALGVYTMSGGTLSVNTVDYPSTGGECIGYAGIGNFIQSGGNNSTNVLSIGCNASSSGAYVLSGTGSLSMPVGSILAVGQSGSGAFTQTGGISSIYQLSIGYEAFSSGAYLLAGNGILNAGYELIGEGGSGTFNQSGGTNAVANWMVISESAQGNYILTGGCLSAIQEMIGYSGAATFIQYGGTNTIVTGDNNELDLGYQKGSSGTYSLYGGSLNVDGNIYVGGSSSNPGGAGNLTLIFLGQLSVSGKLQIYSQGQVNIDAGLVSIGSLSISPGGFLNLNDALTINYQKGKPDPLSTIRSYLQSGYDNGKWDGSGINSSLAATTPGTAIGYVDTGSEIILQFTWLGDANLDGIVDASDLALISPTGSTWSTGDFNYDGKVNADDYSLFMLGLSESGGASIFNTLPEPSFLLATGFWLLASLRIRKNNSSNQTPVNLSTAPSTGHFHAHQQLAAAGG